MWCCYNFRFKYIPMWVIDPWCKSHLVIFFYHYCVLKLCLCCWNWACNWPFCYYIYLEINVPSNFFPQLSWAVHRLRCLCAQLRPRLFLWAGKKLPHKCAGSSGSHRPVLIDNPGLIKSVFSLEEINPSGWLAASKRSSLAIMSAFLICSAIHYSIQYKQWHQKHYYIRFYN